LEKNKENEIVNKILSSIMDTFTVISIDEDILRKALNSEVKDFEDAVIEVSSLQNDIDCIVSRNKEDFTKSRVHCLEPEVFLSTV
jgi:hypothetical protein